MCTFRYTLRIRYLQKYFRRHWNVSSELLKDKKRYEIVCICIVLVLLRINNIDKKSSHIFKMFWILQYAYVTAGGMEDGSGMYQQHGGGTPRSHSTASTASSVSPTGNSGTPMLIVPHPINATKITDAHHVVTHQNGGGRKYTCKMCPSVSLQNYLIEISLWKSVYYGYRICFTFYNHF